MNILSITAPWRKEILRDSEGEGGGGAGAGDGGASNAAPAPADRTAQLESRFNRLATSVEGFMQGQKQREHDGQAQAAERQIQMAEHKANQDVDKAEAALAEAFDDGDGQAIAKAQRTVAEMAATKERIKYMANEARQKLKDSERRDGGTRAEGAGDNLDTANLESWKSKHSSWYGVDKDMTKAAHEVDASIRAAGVIEPGTGAYFDAIDRQMRQKYPGQFNDTPPSAGGSGGGYGGGGGGGRIPASQAEGFRRMGINIDDPAVAKRMIKNREKAVAKGWLPETPATGRILTR